MNRLDDVPKIRTNRNSLFIFSLLLLAGTLAAQSKSPDHHYALRYIPGDAEIVLTFNLQNIGKKLGIEEIRQYDFFKPLARELDIHIGSSWLEVLFFHPEKFGFDINSPFYFFIKEENDIIFSALIVRVSDPGVCQSGFQRYKKEEFLTWLSSKNDYKVWRNYQETFAWNDQIALFLNARRKVLSDPDNHQADFYWPEIEEYDSVHIHWGDDEETIPSFDDILLADSIMSELQSTEDSESEEWQSEDDVPGIIPESHPEIEWMVEDTIVLSWLDEIFQKKINPISLKKNYLESRPNDSEIHFWLNFSRLMESLNTDRLIQNNEGNSGLKQAMPAFNSMLRRMYKDFVMSGRFRFENGKITIRTATTLQPDLLNLYRSGMSGKFNRKFLRYIKGRRYLTGLFYLNFNIRKSVRPLKRFFYNTLSEDPFLGRAVGDLMQILDIIVDEKAIAGIWRGDLLVSVTGMQETEVKSKIYEYDEDFNFIEKDTLQTRNLPIVTAFASYGREKDLMKFINFGISSNVLKPEGLYYRMILPNFGSDVYVAHRRGICIITNNEWLVKQHLQKGYDRKVRLEKWQRRLLRKNASVLYWNIPGTLRMIAGDQADSNIGTAGFMNNFGKEFESVTMSYAKKPDRAVVGKFELQFVRKQENSLRLLLEFVNDLYIEMVGGARI